MNNWLLKMKHWQVFLLFALLYVASKSPFSNQLTNGSLFLVALVGYVGWYAVLGNTLYNYLPRGTTYNLVWFLINAFLLIVSFGAVLILFDGNLQIDGLAAILGFYIFFAIGHLFWLPAAALVASETKKKPEFSQYAGTMLQLIFWPVGIWFIQPRLNRLQASIEAGTFTYSS